MVGRVLIRTINLTALPSKAQAADHLFHRTAQLAVRASAQPHVATCLTGHHVAMAPQAFGQELAVDVPGNPHRASSSCLT